MRGPLLSAGIRHAIGHGVIALLLGATIAACGGGGGGGGGTAATTPPAAPTVVLTPTATKIFRFTWADVGGETEYRLFENPDGTSGYVQVATIGANATSHELGVSLPKRINARYILEACNNLGCTASSPILVGGTLAPAAGYVKASNAGAGDEFGFRVALSADGNTLAVGAVGEDSDATGIGGNQASNSASASGAVYVFVRGGNGAWSQQAYLKASNTGADDGFGWSIALSGDGNTLAVGAYLEDSNATGIGGSQNDNSATNSGAVYVFSRSGTTWTQQAYVKASNAGVGDAFGHSIALSSDGHTLAVGAYGEDSSGNPNDDSAANSGAAYVFTRSGITWSQQAYVKPSNTGAGDWFGYSIALAADGNTLAVGAHREDSNATGIGGNGADDSAADSGAVYVFVRSGVTWTEQAYVKASNTGAGDSFGISVALSGNGSTLVAGAPLEDSVASGIGGNQADNSIGDSGAAYIFTRDGAGLWSQEAYVKASTTGAFDWFGFSVALAADGNTLAIGARHEASDSVGIGGNKADNSAADSGAVYVFARNGTAWAEQAYVKASNTGSGDLFGSSIALSGNGSVLAAGAFAEDSSATGIGGNQASNSASNSGAVYLY